MGCRNETNSNLIGEDLFVDPYQFYEHVEDCFIQNIEMKLPKNHICIRQTDEPIKDLFYERKDNPHFILKRSCDQFSCEITNL